jgi:thymidine kinase
MSLEIVVGPMFSGKTSYALAYVRRQRAIGKRVLVIKPNIDNRYSNESIMITHDGDAVKCMNWDVKVPLCSFNAANEYDCIVIEEGQFFEHLHHACYGLVFDFKKDVLLVGLDGDSKRNKFGEILDCIPYATTLTKLNSLCCVCRDGTLAPYTKRVNAEDNAQQVDVGGAEKYIAVCLDHL